MIDGRRTRTAIFPVETMAEGEDRGDRDGYLELPIAGLGL